MTTVAPHRYYSIGSLDAMYPNLVSSVRPKDLRRSGRTLAGAIAAAVLLILTTAACAGGGGSGLTNALDDRQFVSTSVTGHDLVEDTRVLMSFNAGTLSASAGCNTMSVETSWDRDALVAGDLAMTAIGCDPDRHAQDDWLAGFLASAPTFALDGTTLTLTGEHEQVVLAEILPEPIDAGTWELDGLITGDVAQSVPSGVDAWISLAESEAQFGFGCNDGGATVEISPAKKPGTGSIAFGEGHVTLMACEPTQMEVEGHLAALYTGTVDYTITGVTLTLMGDGIGATYRLQS